MLACTLIGAAVLLAASMMPAGAHDLSISCAGPG